MTFTITYERDVVRKDIPALPPKAGREIKVAMERKLTVYPALFGKPLRGSLKNHWSLRVGDYRVIYRITDDIVRIFAIELRSTVYQTVRKRI